LWWAVVQYLLVVGSFDAAVDAAVSFDNAGVGSVAAVRVEAFLYFFNGFAVGAVEAVRGKSPPGW
jgi:hypothetical protein